MFRGSSKVFATNAAALKIANEAIDRGFDLEIERALRTYLYLPFEHSDTLTAQNRSVELIRQLIGQGGDTALERWALEHRVIITRFSASQSAVRPY